MLNPCSKIKGDLIHTHTHTISYTKAESHVFRQRCTYGSDPKIVFIIPKISNKNLLWPLYIIIKQQICSFIKYIYLVTMVTGFAIIDHLNVKSALTARWDGILKNVKLENIQETLWKLGFTIWLPRVRVFILVYEFDY